MIEIEAKIWLDKHNIKYEDILKKLQKEYKFNGIKNKSDIYFINDKNHIFRLRDCNNKYIITSKIRNCDNCIEMNIENEFEVNNKNEFISFTKKIGYVFYKQKQKHTMEFQTNDCTIELNKIEGLWDFLEIECLCENIGNKNEAQQKIETILKDLWFNNNQFETKRYLDLIEEKKWKQS